MTAAAIRPGRDEDAEGFIALIGTAWSEFPGCVLDVDAEMPELRTLASHFEASGGALWAAEQDGRLVGMVATRPLRHDEAYEICRMYVARECRGTGLARCLLALAEDHARAAGAARLVLWTDTRFEAAHRFYEKHGYVRQGAIRILDDLSKSLEFRYAKPARGLVVEALDAAAAASAERRLSRILVDCVAAGGSVPFFPPWRRSAPAKPGARSRRRSRPARACCWRRGATARWSAPRRSTSARRRTSRTAARLRRCWWTRRRGAPASAAP